MIWYFFFQFTLFHGLSFDNHFGLDHFFGVPPLCFFCCCVRTYFGGGRRFCPEFVEESQVILTIKIYLSIYLSVYLAFYLSIYLSRCQVVYRCFWILLLTLPLGVESVRGKYYMNLRYMYALRYAHIMCNTTWISCIWEISVYVCPEKYIHIYNV